MLEKHQSSGESKGNTSYWFSELETRAHTTKLSFILTTLCRAAAARISQLPELPYVGACGKNRQEKNKNSAEQTNTLFHKPVLGLRASSRKTTLGIICKGEHQQP